MRFILPIVMVTMFFSALAQRVVLDTLAAHEFSAQHENRHRHAKAGGESVCVASRDL